ncbi:MAG TPA: ribosome maturation factor RimP [Thermodesulfovibrionales bacterium]|nr:ribosome maturation factor RimP [Thermodesulfovibrionales bacterium]
MDKSVEEKIYSLANRVAEECCFEVVDMQLWAKGKRTLLRVFIDREGGITLDDCETFSRKFEALLDVEDPITGPYTLEVSSPGLDRPLKNAKDFRKNLGKMVRIVTKEKINNQSFFVGRLEAINDQSLILSFTDNGGEVQIPLGIISRANLELELK